MTPPNTPPPIPNRPRRGWPLWIWPVLSLPALAGAVGVWQAIQPPQARETAWDLCRDTVLKTAKPADAAAVRAANPTVQQIGRGRFYKIEVVVSVSPERILRCDFERAPDRWYLLQATFEP